MPDKVEKPKKQKKDEKGVLAALPSTRPERIGTRRASAPKTFDQPEAAQAAAKPTARAKPGAAAKTRAAAKTAAAKKRAAPRATAARRKAAAPRTFEPTAAAESAAGAADERAAGAVPRAADERAAGAVPRGTGESKPRAVREGAPGIGERERAPAGRADEAVSPEHGRPSGVELVSTAVQAAGELTQIGLSLGGRLVKRAVDRLPKP